MLKLIASITSLLVFLTMVFGLFFWFEKRYCHASTFLNFAQNTRYELKSNQIEKLNERTWQLEKRLKENPADVTSVEELQKIKEKKVEYLKQLEELGKIK